MSRFCQEEVTKYTLRMSVSGTYCHGSTTLMGLRASFMKPIIYQNSKAGVGSWGRSYVILQAKHQTIENI